jgi:hypothetical protein
MSLGLVRWTCPHCGTVLTGCGPVSLGLSRDNHLEFECESAPNSEPSSAEARPTNYKAWPLNTPQKIQHFDPAFYTGEHLTAFDHGFLADLCVCWNYVL